MPLLITTLNITTFGIMTFIIMTISTTTFSIMTCSITILSIKTLTRCLCWMFLLLFMLCLRVIIMSGIVFAIPQKASLFNFLQYRNCIRNTSFSSQLTNWPNKLDWEALSGINSLAYKTQCYKTFFVCNLRFFVIS